MSWPCLQVRPSSAIKYAPDKARHVPDAIANNFMASPQLHPLFTFLMQALPLMRGFEVLKATGPVFLSRAISEYRKETGLARLRNMTSTKCSDAESCHVIVYKIPVVYASGWRGHNPCKNGLEAEIDACAALPSTISNTTSILATFWTMTWKQNSTSLQVPSLGTLP